MAEKGILVNDQAGGESVACRDARLPDEAANSRIIQVNDLAPKPVVLSGVIAGTPLRTVVVTDSNDVGQTVLPAGISGNPLDVSDAQTGIIYAKVSMGNSNTDGNVVITPFIMTEDATPVLVALLPPIQLRPISPQKTAAGLPYDYFYIFGANNSGVAVYPSQLESFPTFGAKNIGFHIYFDGDVSQVDLFAFSTTVVHKTSKLDTDLYGGVWGPATFPKQQLAA